MTTPGWSKAGVGSSPGAVPTLAEPFRAGDLLAGRYRLAEPVGGAGNTVLWRAVDEVLARPVAVKLLPAGGPGGRDAAQPFLDAAVRAGALGHPGLVRVYDAGLETPAGATGEVAYVISEWVDGSPLPDVLADGPLDAVAATDLLRQAADALSAAHARGVAHGRLHPGNVFVTGSGRLRVTDVAVGASVHAPDDAADVTSDAVRADTRDLAAVLYALLTGRWPSAATPQPACGLPSAPAERQESSRPYSPRQVRAGVPRALDLVVSRGLDPARHPELPVLATPAALADAAEQAAEQSRETHRRRATDPGPPSQLRRSVPWLVAGAVVAAIGTGGWLLGLAVGELPRRDGAVENVVSTGSSPRVDLPGFRRRRRCRSISPGSRYATSTRPPATARNHQTRCVTPSMATPPPPGPPRDTRPPASVVSSRESACSSTSAPPGRLPVIPSKKRFPSAAFSNTKVEVRKIGGLSDPSDSAGSKP